MTTSPDMSAAWGSDSITWPHLPDKAAVLTSMGVTHRSRFAVAVNAAAPMQARTVARSVMTLMLGASEASAAVNRQVQTCISELVAIAYTRALGTHMLCELWRDSEHIFMGVQHDEPLPLLPDDTTIGLNVVKVLAADYGSNMVDGASQMWAAIRLH
jgi:hypothetical protein